MAQHERSLLKDLPTIQRYGLAVVSVSDTGIGLPEHHADPIFIAFLTTKHQGIGMGLSISRSIVEMQGGRLWAEEYAGGGAIFSSSLPAAGDAVI